MSTSIPILAPTSVWEQNRDREVERQKEREGKAEREREILIETIHGWGRTEQGKQIERRHRQGKQKRKGKKRRERLSWRMREKG